MSNSKIVQLERFSFNKSIMIGEGKFGKVYRGNDSKTNQPVCIKVFQKKQEFGENVLETVNQKELDLTKQMINEQHENLVKIIDVCDNDNLGEAYMIMELCDNSMTQYVKEKKMLNREEILDFIQQVTNGYYRLEERNIVHRDMKPDNILIIKENEKVRYKIGDFGLGKLLEERQEMTTKNIGTIYYQAPEIAITSQKYTNKCDIFSFGIMIFELLVGNNTFKPQQTREKLKTQKFEEIFAVQLKEVDVWLKKLLSSMIIYESEKRIGWKELKVIIDLNMFDIRYEGIFGRMEDDLFLGKSKDEKNIITVNVLKKEDHNEIQRDFQFIEPYSPLDTTNAIKINEIINKPNNPLIYVIMEDCDCNLQALMESSKFTSDEVINFLEQIINGWDVLSLSQKQIYSLSLQNILIKFNGVKKDYKITNYEFYQMRDKRNNQLIVQRGASVQQLAWIIYQILIQQVVGFNVYQQEIKQQAKIMDALKNIDSNLSNILQSIMTPESNCKISWQGLQDSISNLRNDRPRSFTAGSQIRNQTNQPQQSTIAQQPLKIQIPNIQPQDQSKFNQGFQSPQSNINFQRQGSYKIPQFQGNQITSQQSNNLQINQQQQQNSPTVQFNPNFQPPQQSSPAGIQFAPKNQAQQNQPQMNNINFSNPNQQTNSAIQQQPPRFNTQKPQQPAQPIFLPNQQQQQIPQQTYQLRSSVITNRATLMKPQTQFQQQQPQNPAFLNSSINQWNSKK